MCLARIFISAHILLFVLIQSLSANPHDQIHPRIVGGFETTIKRYPWQVSLESGGRFICGGSIIGNRWILTAAHCSFFERIGYLAVRVGSSHLGKGGSVVKVKRKIERTNFEKFMTGYDNDFSLLELSEPLIFSDKIKPIALPKSNTEITVGTMALVSGWGFTNNSKNQTAIKLRAVRVPITSQKACQDNYKMKITDRMICAGYKEGGKDACEFDSGGPLVVNFEEGNPQLIGVVSSGSKSCGGTKRPGIYARVTSALSWISKITGI